MCSGKHGTAVRPDAGRASAASAPWLSSHQASHTGCAGRCVCYPPTSRAEPSVVPCLLLQGAGGTPNRALTYGEPIFNLCLHLWGYVLYLPLAV